MSLLQRFYDPAAGRILIGGVDIKDVSVHSLRSCIGIVSQEPVLFAASIKDNILLGKPDATDTEVEDACVRANAHDFISKMATGYDTLVGPKGSQVSGGQKQRVSIARAVYVDADVYLFDDPLSALDAEVGNKIFHECILGVLAHKTRIIALNQTGFLTHANQIVLMQNTRVQQVGSQQRNTASAA